MTSHDENMEYLNNMKSRKSCLKSGGNREVQHGSVWNKWNLLDTRWTKNVSFGRRAVVLSS